MTEPENSEAKTTGTEPAARPILDMTGSPAIDAPPPQVEEADEAENSESPSAAGEESKTTDDIWSVSPPDLDALPAPDEADELEEVAEDPADEQPAESIDLSVDDTQDSSPDINVAALAPAAQPSPSDLTTTATAVRRWAADNDVDSDPYVVELTEDLMHRRRLTYWASLDPLENLPTPAPKAGTRLRTLARAVLLLRNVGVFVPVALTWFAINKATDAFGTYANLIRNTPDLTAEERNLNFLEFWQSGGPGGDLLEGSWRIQHIAFLDALIIAVIILLTLVAGALDGQANIRVARRQVRADKDRTAVALTIGKSLHGNRSASPESIGEALALALTDLSEAARNVAAATTRLEGSTSAFDALTPRLESLSQQVTNLNRHFATDVVNSVSSLSSSVAELGTTLGGDMNRFLSEVLAGIEEINESFKKTSVTVEFGTKQLRDDLDAIHRSLSQVVGRR
jgi:hypothetical protein